MVGKQDLCHSIANINLHKCHKEHFSLVLLSFMILIFKIFYLEYLGHGHRKNETYAGRLQIFECEILADRQHTKTNEFHIHTARYRVMIIGKICKANLHTKIINSNDA